ncbi:MAG: hypothetical protein NTV34_18560 [Proteobacteria bacterium]|nr:hypothetical protein [Pseudomonadota bacterium]
MNTYLQYVQSLRDLGSIATAEVLPKVFIVFGPSEFLRRRTFNTLKTIFSKFEISEPQHNEAQNLEPMSFRCLWAQQSLFDPKPAHIVRRCDKHSKLAAWLKEIKTCKDIRSRLVFEFNDKIPAELNRQLNRLEALALFCIEPNTTSECEKIIINLARREGLMLADDAVKLLIESCGIELGPINNEIMKMSMVFQGRNDPIKAHDIASIIGVVREDHVFELFSHLRNRQKSKAHLLLDSLLERGEKGLALNGILSRYAREQVARNPERGVRGLQLCAQADVLLKTNRSSENFLLANIIDSLTDN